MHSLFHKISSHRFVATLTGLITLFFIIAYFTLDTLGVYDAPAHVLAVENAREFWPNWYGWSPEMLGWPQGALYPPTIHWIMTGLSFVIGVPMAVKVLVVLAIATLPLALWWYIRSVGYTSQRKIIALGIIGIILLIAPDYMGSNIKSLFQVGLITNFIALPLMLFSLAALERLAQLSSNRRKRTIIAGLLFSTVIWTHLVAAIVVVLYGIALIVEKLIRHQPKQVIGLLQAAGLGIIFSLPFIITMGSFWGEQPGTQDGITSLLLPNIAVTILSLGNGYLLIKQKQPVAARLAFLAALLGIVGTLDALLMRFFGTSFVLERLHAYRFQIFAYMFLSLSLVGLSIPKFAGLFSKRPIVAKSLLVGVIIIAVAIANPFTFPYAQVTVNPQTTVQGRFLESFSRQESYPAPYTFQSKLALTNPDSAWAYGLFTESAANAVFVNSLSRNLTDQPITSDHPIISTVIPADKQQDLLDLFAVEYIVSLDENEADAAGIWMQGEQQKYYHIEDRAKQQLVEIPRYSLEPVAGNWDVAITDWWQQPGKLTTLPYDASDKSLPDTTVATDSNVTVTSYKPGHISFTVTSPHAVPVLIKETYSHKWRAYDDQGNVLQIWKVAPSFMLVFANGQVTVDQQ